MPNSTVPAADTGLPNLNSGSLLMETERGLSVCRALKSPRTSILPAESLDEFLSLLARYVKAGDREDAFRHIWGTVGSTYQYPGGHEKWRDAVGKIKDDGKVARRALIRHLRIVREAPARSLDDVLFKAELCAVLEPWDVKQGRTTAHSIVRDLLSADCSWRA